MTSKTEYKAHVKRLLEVWIRMLEQDPSDETIKKVVEAMLYEKEGRESPVSLGGKA